MRSPMISSTIERASELERRPPGTTPVLSVFSHAYEPGPGVRRSAFSWTDSDERFALFTAHDDVGFAVSLLETTGGGGPKPPAVATIS